MYTSIFIYIYIRIYSHAYVYLVVSVLSDGKQPVLRGTVRKDVVDIRVALHIGGCVWVCKYTCMMFLYSYVQQIDACLSA